MDLKRVIGVVVLILLVYYFKDSTSYILKANPLYFLLSILCYVSLNLILALRMKFILEKLGDKTGFSEVFKTHMASMITSDVTPGRSGYLAFPKFGERYGMNFHISTASLFSTQAVEMIVKVFGSSLAIAYLLSPEDLVALFVPAILTISASVYLWTDVIPIKIKRLEKIREYSKLSGKFLLELLIFTLVGWILVGLQWFFISKSLNLDVTLVQSMLLQPLLSLAMFVPLTPAGAGFFEGGTAFIFSQLGISPEKAIAFALLVRVSTILADLPGIIYFAEPQRPSS